MKIYRGDTFEFDFSAEFENGNPYIFQTGDVLKAGIKNTLGNEKYMLYQKKIIEDDIQTVTFLFPHEETINLTPRQNCILEVELTDTSGKVLTLYQKPIEIAGDVINE